MRFDMRIFRLLWGFYKAVSVYVPILAVGLAVALSEVDEPWLLTYGEHPLIRELYAEQVVVTREVSYPSRYLNKAKARVANLWICPRSQPHILLAEDEPEVDVLELLGTQDEEAA